MNKKILFLVLSLGLCLGLGQKAYANDDARIYGENRYETNRKIVEKLHKEEKFKDPRTVILVSGEVFPDTLSASNLSRVKKSPLVLSPKNNLDKNTKETLNLLKAKTIIVVGGPNSISEKLFNELGQKYEVSRIWGEDRYKTSQKVVDAAEAIQMSQGNVELTGEIYKNALTVTKFAEENNYNILLSPAYSAKEIAIKAKGEEKLVAGQSFEEINRKILAMTEESQVALASVNSFPDAISAANLSTCGNYKILLCQRLNDELIAANPKALIVGGPNTLAYEDKYNILNDLAGQKMEFSSGVGGWGTTIQFLEEGYFVGMYSDWNYDRSYRSVFQGKFSVDKKINDLHYRLKLEGLGVLSPTGKVKMEIDNNRFHPVEYVNSCYGLEGSQYFDLYLRGSQVKELPEDFVGWIYGLKNQRSLDTYGLYNINKGYGMKVYESGFRPYFEKEVMQFIR